LPTARSCEDVVDLLPKIKVELLLDHEQAARATEIITTVARTGHIADGEIFMLPVDDMIRIRTGERGDPAI
jgi:nitrogen regulatory protein P-II 1